MGIACRKDLWPCGLPTRLDSRPVVLHKIGSMGRAEGSSPWVEYHVFSQGRDMTTAGLGMLVVPPLWPVSTFVIHARAGSVCQCRGAWERCRAPSASIRGL
ncbi:hypothetical protein Stsp01_54480 [Streptomyces sp. NBRC 13847]|nr:hypothetical protein Stsp01_54480 [Streptomyces sp. NBRC 13847]